MCYRFEADLLDELEPFTDVYFGFLKETAVTIGRVARQVAPIVTAIPIPQAEIIGDGADLIGNVWADMIDALANEWRAGLDDGAR